MIHGEIETRIENLVGDVEMMCCLLQSSDGLMGTSWKIQWKGIVNNNDKQDLVSNGLGESVEEVKEWIVRS